MLHGHYSASTLIRTHPPPSRRRSISRLRRLYDLPCSGDFSPGRGGLLQLLGMSLSPCCRFHPAEVKVPRRPDFGTPCCLRPSVAGSALGSTHFRGHLRVHCRYGPVTRNLPTGDLVDRLQKSWFPATLLSKLRGLLTLAPAGLSLLNMPAFSGHTTGHADFPHPAFSRSIRPSLSAGQCDFAECGRARACRAGGPASIARSLVRDLRYAAPTSAAGAARRRP